MPGLKDVYALGMSAHGFLGRRLGGWALPPAQLFLEVTDRCNLDCRMCFYRGTLGEASTPMQPDADHLTAEEIERVVRDLPTARLVSISGGEPFARADLVAILTRLAALRLVTVETNGTLLDAAGARALAALGSRGLPRPGLAAVDFSILGPRDVHDAITRRAGSFDRALAALRTLRDERNRLGRRFPKLTLKSAVLKENLGALEALAQLARAEAVDYFVLKEEDPGKVTLRPGADGVLARGEGTKAPHTASLDGLAARLRAILASFTGGPTEAFLIPLDVTPDHLEHHIRKAVDLGTSSCRHPWSRVGVLPRGEVYACKLFSTRSVRQHSIREIWNGPEFREFRSHLRSRGPFPSCVGCCFLEPGPAPRAATASRAEATWAVPPVSAAAP
ncbi:MAG: radical SAM protein [bacterium]